ncbi:Fanconi anemia group C protein isoform X1 [Denticeps clupeoides]|uniref:Fanconi anemia group C protein n=2 Tax=Denticeps clupeoides TaxID=299321 RepID=A0AAY4A8U1_9TELE|nr:Fanconi anemia group C protein isoform X1 [Denticeps clupeoides]
MDLGSGRMAPFSEPDVRFWMAKAVEWGQATAPFAQLDTVRSLGGLRDFLQTVLGALQLTSSTTDAVQTLPFVGQFLGRLCWNPLVTADEESRTLLLQCLWCLFTTEPRNTIEQNANEWIRKVLCHLAVDDGVGSLHPVNFTGSPYNKHHANMLKKMVSVLAEDVLRACSRTLENPTDRCCCDDIFNLSVACAPLVTRSEVAPLIGALLKRPVSCPRPHLSEEFVEAVNSALQDKKLHVEEEAVMTQWCCSLTSLEGTVLSLVQSFLSQAKPNLHSLQGHISDSLLPKACVLHCPVFLIVNNIFRTLLLEMEESLLLQTLIKFFTCAFLKAHAAQVPEERLSPKNFFPLVPQSLLMSLITSPSEVPTEVWLDHLTWISTEIQRVAGDASDGEEDTPRVFEAWFLLIHCGMWVDVAAQLLGSRHPEHELSACSVPLLWLLTFFYHPTNRGHHRMQQCRQVRRIWGKMQGIFSECSCPDDCEHVNVLLSTSLSKHLILSLLLNLAVFSQQPCGRPVGIIHKLLEGWHLKMEAELIIDNIEIRLNDSSAGPRVKSRLKTIRDSF